MEDHIITIIFPFDNSFEAAAPHHHTTSLCLAEEEKGDGVPLRQHNRTRERYARLELTTAE